MTNKPGSVGVNFSLPVLLDKYGSWMAAQVAFYDYLFISATEVCPACFNAIASGKDYEETIDVINKLFPTQEEAFSCFLDWVDRKED